MVTTCVEGDTVASFHRILVGWDASKDAQRALRAAAHLAVDLAAEVVALGVLKRPAYAEAMDEAEEEFARRRGQVASEVEEATRLAGFPSSVRIRVETVAADSPAPALAGYATEHGFDLLVVGRHGLDRAVHPRAGGMTEYLVRHSRCPLLVVGED